MTRWLSLLALAPVALVSLTWAPLEADGSAPLSPEPKLLEQSTHPLVSVVAAGSSISDPLLLHHQREHGQLLVEQAAVTKQIREMQVQMELLNVQIQNEERVFEEMHANVDVQRELPSPRGARERELSCRGWKKTSRCLHSGARRPAQDASCLTTLHGGAAGYCEVRDERTGESFRAMRANCSSVWPRTAFSCALAPPFANFPAGIERALAQPATPDAAAVGASNGIVMVALAAQVPRVARAIHTLRALGCTLPLEVWFFQREMTEWSTAAMDALVAVTVADASTTLRPLTTLESSVRTSHYAKLHAISLSAFRNVLYLDAAMVPLRDPTYLFSLPEFQSTGAVFWPDLLHRETARSHVEADSLLWELLDMPFARVLQQDDRQLLLARDSAPAQKALRVLQLFASHEPNLFDALELVDRGRDFAQLAWLRARAPFHAVASPPALVGSLLADDSFCGSHIVQHDPSGAALFLHEQQPEHHASLTHTQTVEWRQQDVDGAPPRLGNDERVFQCMVRSFERGSDPSRAICLVLEPVKKQGQEARVAVEEWTHAAPAASVHRQK